MYSEAVDGHCESKCFCEKIKIFQTDEEDLIAHTGSQLKHGTTHTNVQHGDIIYDHHSYAINN